MSVSVVIPCYNAVATLGDVLASVAAQTVPVAEVIVVDDGSSDGSAEAAARMESLLAPAHLIVVRQANAGVAQARNTGLKHVTQPLVAFLDSDDCWRAGKIEAQLKVMADEAIALCGTDFVTVAGLRAPRGVVTTVRCSEVRRPLYEANFLATSSVIARTAAVRLCGGFDESLPVCEDHDLWQKMAAVGGVVVVPEVLMEYLDRPGSLSKRAGLLWWGGMRLAWRHRQGYAAMLRQMARVSAVALKNRLQRGPMAGGERNIVAARNLTD